MSKALEGVKVLDLTHAYNGADVLKIENPKGDQCRFWGLMDEKKCFLNWQRKRM